MPVNPWYQVLMIASAGQSGCALLGFFEEDVLQLPPGRLQVELIAEEQIGFRSGPVHEIVCVCSMVAAIGPRTVYHGYCLSWLMGAGPCLFKVL